MTIGDYIKKFDDMFSNRRIRGKKLKKHPIYEDLQDFIRTTIVNVSEERMRKDD